MAEPTAKTDLPERLRAPGMHDELASERELRLEAADYIEAWELRTQQAIISALEAADAYSGRENGGEERLVMLVNAVTSWAKKVGAIRPDIERLSGPDCLMLLEGWGKDEAPKPSATADPPPVIPETSRAGYRPDPTICPCGAPAVATTAMAVTSMPAFAIFDETGRSHTHNPNHADGASGIAYQCSAGHVFERFGPRCWCGWPTDGERGSRIINEAGT